MDKQSNAFNTLVVITPKDFARLQKLYPRLCDNISYGSVCFVGSEEVGKLLKDDPVLNKKAEFINENDIISFNEVHKCIAMKMTNILAGRELPRGITGWYYQQFLKMQYARLCNDEYYMVWDGDTIPCQKLNMFQEESGKPYLDLKHEYHKEYFDTMAVILPGFSKVIERSFISEHMLIRIDIMSSLIDEIEKNDALEGTAFWEKIINAIPEDKIQSSSFSEFETYGTYVALKHSSVYKLREWHSFRQGGTFFSIDTISDRDFKWLAHDFNAISFEKGHTVREDNANLFDNPYYQEKLTPKQMLQAAQLEYTEGYKEVWADDANVSTANVSAGSFSNTADVKPEDRLKYLSEDTYQIYEELGDSCIDKNYDQAYLCYENAEYLCDDESRKKILREKKDRLINQRLAVVNKVAIVILSFNNTYCIQRCIESIYTNCNPDSFLLIIFDNGSKDGTAEWLASWGEKHDEVIIILSVENLGFSGGNNAACQYIPEGYDVFFLNNDTRIPANALFWLRMGLYKDKKIGATGGIQNYFYNNKFEKVEYSVVEQYMEYGAQNNVPMENAYELTSKLCGFAMLISRKAYDATSGFDERFNPGYFEDDDLSLQIRSAGYELVVCHNSFIYHVGSQSFRKRDDLQELLAAHRSLLVEKWGFDSTIYASLSENEISYINSIEEKGYGREDSFSALHIGCGCGNMLGLIKYLYPNCEVAGIEELDVVRAFAVPGISVFKNLNELPKSVEEYDLVAQNLG